MTDTRRLQELDQRHIWHPFTQMKDWGQEAPIVITRGEGVWLYDTDGNRYLDGVASMWTNVHGHCRREINDALKTQVERLEHSTLLGLANEPSILLAERLAGILPDGLSRIFYSDNGSTSVEVGLKMAFQYHRHIGGPQGRKSKFIAFSHSYHGDTIGAVSVGGIDIFHEVFRPLLFRTIQAPAPYCYRCSLGKNPESCGMACLAKLEEIMVTHADEVAGLVIEPLVQGAGGMIIHPQGFLAEVRRLCDRYDILMIADEVAVGFGRTGTMFACQREQVVPDIMALSKGLTAGYLPMAVTVTSEKIFGAFLGEYRELKTFFHGHTFTGNPLGCAVALASLDLFEQTSLLDHIGKMTDHLAQRLEMVRDLEHVGDVRQCGLVAGIELVADTKTREPYDWEQKVGVRVCLEARRHQLFLRPLGNVIVVFPPLCITAEEIDFLVSGVEAAIRTVTEA